MPAMVSPAAAWRAYVGCRTTAERHARGQGIAMYGVSEAGSWTFRHLTPAGDNPSFLCLHPNGRTLYTVHGDRDAISAFGVNPEDGALRHVGTWQVQGRNPVHLAVSPSGRWLLVACYATGSVSSLPLQADGRPGDVASIVRIPGAPGPRAEHQTGSHPHQVVFDPSGRWLLVPDKGLDGVSLVHLDEASGELSFASMAAFPPGSGPRHLVFSPHRPQLYVVCELSSEVCVCRFEPADGRMEVLQTLPTAPSGAGAGNTAAGIALDTQGKRLYVSNRGDDSVASYAVDAGTGFLLTIGFCSSGGHTPRFITMAAVGSSLVVANEDSDSIFRLSPPSFAPLASTASPVCILFSKEST